MSRAECNPNVSLSHLASLSQTEPCDWPWIKCDMTLRQWIAQAYQHDPRRKYRAKWCPSCTRFTTLSSDGCYTPRHGLPRGQRLFRHRSVSEVDTNGGFTARRPNHRNLEKVGSCLMIRWRIRWEAEQNKGHDHATSSCSGIGGDLCCRVYSGLCAQLSFCLWARNWWLCAQI
jgi:hypothetical protein